jgi:hypothetical protein
MSNPLVVARIVELMELRMKSFNSDGCVDGTARNTSKLMMSRDAARLMSYRG